MFHILLCDTPRQMDKRSKLKDYHQQAYENGYPQEFVIYGLLFHRILMVHFYRIGGRPMDQSHYGTGPEKPHNIF